MSKPLGRPKVENPKNISVKIRFDKESYAELTTYCEEHQVTRTEAIREGVRLVLSQK